MRQLKLLLLLVGIVCLAAYYFMTPTISGSGVEQTPPTTALPGEPVELPFIVNIWGGGGPIEGRVSNIKVLYKLDSETIFQSVTAKPAELPPNYKNAVANGNQWAAYTATLPAYPANSHGQIVYMIELSVDGHPSTVPGLHPIPLAGMSLKP